MQLIIGLGNPGSRYDRTRHNFGFWVLDAVAGERGLAFGPGKGDYVEAVHARAGLALVKPTAFMNQSGVAVRDALAFFKVAPAEILVVVDDIDLPLGSLRFRARGGAGGHKGLASVIASLGEEEFPRLRLGIATDAPLRPSEKYVLEPFPNRDKPLVDQVRSRAVEAIGIFLDQGMDRAMTRFNQPPLAESETHITETQAT